MREASFVWIKKLNLYKIHCHKMDGNYKIVTNIYE